MMVHLRKRFPVEEAAKINEFICTGKWPEAQRNVDRNDENDSEPSALPANAADEAEISSALSKQSGKPNRNTSQKKKKQRKTRKKNRGKRLLDATAVPADIKYPTDIDLQNKSREHLETAIEILWKEVLHKSHKLPYSSKKARKFYLKFAKSKKWTRVKYRKAIGEQLNYIAQQKEMIENNTHVCADRIVSLAQPHVCSISRR